MTYAGASTWRRSCSAWAERPEVRRPAAAHRRSPWPPFNGDASIMRSPTDHDRPHPARRRRAHRTCRSTSNILPLAFVSVVLWRYSPWLVVTLVGMVAVTGVAVTPLIVRRQRIVNAREIAAND